MSAGHTPTPWVLDQYGSVRTGREYVTANGFGMVMAAGDNQDEAKANTALIVRAVNSHEALLELAYQYESDLRYPPTADSRDRRLERIAEVLAKAGAA